MSSHCEMIKYRYHKKTVVVALLLLVSSSLQSSINDQVTLQSIQEQTNNNCSLIINNNSSRLVHKLRTKRFVFDFIGGVSSILDFYDSISRKIKGDSERNFLTEQLRKIETTLNEMSDKLNSIENNIKNEHANTKLFGDERTIRNCLDYTKALASNPSNADFKQDVIRTCQDVENAVKNILSSVNGQGVFGSDLLQITYNSDDSHRRNFNSRIIPILELIAIGAVNLSIYFNLQNITNEKRQLTRQWLKEQDDIIKRRFQEYEGKFLQEDQVKPSIKNLLIANRGKSNEELVNVIQNYLQERWDKKMWFVFVNDEINCWDSHAISEHFHMVFREGGKCVIARSHDGRGALTVEQKNEMQSKVFRYCKFYDFVSYTGWGWQHRCCRYGARSIFKDLQTQSELGPNYALAVVRSNSNGRWSSNIGHFVDFQLKLKNCRGAASWQLTRILVLPGRTD